MPFSVRLDAGTQALIDRLARSSGRSRASILREAVTRYAVDADDGRSAYERLKPFVGRIDSGDGNLSQHTGKQLTALLRKRPAHRARRTR